MSHFSRVRTKMVDRDLLVAALRDLGHEPLDRATVRGWRGNTQAADVVIASVNPSYDVGFVSTKNGFEMVCDWYGVRGIDSKTFPRELQQRYAYVATRSRLEDQGYELVEEDKQQDGSVRLVLRRLS